MRMLGAGVVATDDDSVHGLLMLLDERGHGLAGVIQGSRGERVRVSWRQPDTAWAQQQRPARWPGRLVLWQLLWVHPGRVIQVSGP